MGSEHLLGEEILLGSVADPDPDWIRIQRGPWIRIGESKNDPQKYVRTQVLVIITLDPNPD